MKYFTIDHWMAGQDLSNDPALTRVAEEEYERYFRSVRDRLPAAYLRMIDEWYLHDSTLAALDVDPASRSTRLRLASWKHDRSGGILEITYHGVTSVRAVSDPKKGLPGPSGFGDLGYDELEILNDDLFEHRILFSSGIELRFTFGSLEYEEGRGA